MFLLISRTPSDDTRKKIHSLVNAGIDAYAIIDKDLDVSTKRFIHYDNEELEKEGYLFANVTLMRLRETYRITGWDKALYHAYKSKAKYVWICEDDVYWNRPAVLKMILDQTQSMNDDLICTKLAPSVEEKPNWFHWPKAQQLTQNKKKWMGTFNQFSRVSNRLLEAINRVAKHQKKLLLHEVLLPTVCRMNNLKVSYLSDLKLPIYIDIHWSSPFTPEQIEELKQDNSYILLHPYKTPELAKAVEEEYKK